MKIAGFLKNSFVDYPNYISAVIFTQGCNFNCCFCHNKQTISNEEKTKISLKEIYEFLNSRKGLIEGVVFTGGEPTLQPDLLQVMVSVKELGFKIKLDTNGLNPEVIQNCINEKCVDYIAMDIKTSFENYEKLINKNINIDKIKESINLIQNSGVDYEFRTTFAPDVTIEDIKKIAKEIKNAKAYYIQKYNVVPSELQKIPHNVKDYEDAEREAKQFLDNVQLRSM